MLFNSWQFLVFFVVTTLLYYLLPFRFRWALLLLASCIFYVSFIPIYILILGATIVVDYCAAIFMESSKSPQRRRLWLVISIFATCLILFFFKYYNFVATNLNAVAQLLDWNYSIRSLGLLLPIGLSFHTFQSLSYVIEVYRGNQKPERHFGIYSLYVMFYPQLVAGPIERPQNLLPQFRKPHTFDAGRIGFGLRLAAWGLFKKVVIADRLACFVSPVYSSPKGHSGPELFLATIFFTFEIFCDFSGYSDIALGVAEVLGFRLMRNFYRPYLATSVAEFWKRWHISLSTWLRDYIYEPIALNLRDKGLAGIVIALVVTFLVSGFWHGANWTFVVWGLLNGSALCVEVMLAGPRRRLKKSIPGYLYNGIGFLITFTFVNLAYIFFRSQTLKDAWDIVTNVGTGWSRNSWSIDSFQMSPLSSLLNSKTRELWLSVALIVLLFVSELVLECFDSKQLSDKLPRWVRWAGYQCMLFAIVLLGVWFERRQFIYFQF